MIVKNSVKVRLRLYSAGCCQPPHSRLGRTCRARCGHSWSPLNTWPRMQLVMPSWKCSIYFSPIMCSRNNKTLLHADLKTILRMCQDKLLKFIFCFMFQYQNRNLLLKLANMYADFNLLVAIISWSDL